MTDNQTSSCLVCEVEKPIEPKECRTIDPKVSIQGSRRFFESPFDVPKNPEVDRSVYRRESVIR